MKQPARRTALNLPLVVAMAMVLAASAMSGLAITPQPARAALAVIGRADDATVQHDRTLVWAPSGVLANDVNLLGSTTANLVSSVSHGTLDLRSNGGFTYAPDPGFVGTDSFRYLPSGLLSTGATVTITVTNAAPSANPDSYTWAGGTLTVAAPGVLANDDDADGDALAAELDGGGISGSFDLDQNGGFRYTPGGGFSGTGVVHYRVWDGVAWSATTTITLTLQPATPLPSPTPRPTSGAMPTPTPVPTPTLPLPTDAASPTPDHREEDTRPSPSPIASGSEEDRSESPVSPGSPESPASPGSGSDREREDSGHDTGPLAAGTGAEGSRLIYDRERLDLQTGSLGFLTGFQVWAVPAATLGVSGLLVLLWVALQVIGGLVWMPAVRRLRGKEKQYLA